MRTLVNSDPAKVLVIDNHDHSRTATKDLLLLDGYNVLEVEEGLEVTHQVLTECPDLIVLDVMMPQMTGFEVCQRLKAEESTRCIPIIFTTVTDESHLRKRCNQVGGDDLLIKPLKRLEFLTRVKSLIGQKRLAEELDQIEQVLFAIAKAIENRYPDSGNSCTRLATLAQSFGNYLHLSALDIQDLRYAAYLHDIGTIGIPDEILLKEGALTPQERDILQQHVLIGEEICQPLPNWRRVLPIIRHHHERWDGSGYPDGLIEDEIPALAQVFQILDIYVALTSKRPYKDSYTSSQALEIIQMETDKGWRNPELVSQLTQFIGSSNDN